jgi:DNA-binding MarR family transcriptional regulator
MVHASEARSAALVEALYLVVHRAHRLRSARVHSSCDKAGLVLLHLLMEQGPMRVSDLAASVQLDPSTVSRQVRALCEGGFAQVYEDPDDKRARVLSINQVGRAEIESVSRELRAVLGHAVSTWSTSDVETLTALLGRLAEELAPEVPEQRNTHVAEETAG